jgi:hypothetical protein
MGATCRGIVLPAVTDFISVSFYDLLEENRHVPEYLA